ncbi:preprotein translocase SecG subunit [Afipia carboxidovorans OM5]|uniref:Protein-export membrane protein SecG n=1 Tax=Afipia carboxidovorans (strain ATCC 49405 / DSM 1227 / KCTC 32145 / OM5) TaxID=504832 RepID=B6JFZ1_AFIC5|nr:preprotein translocase subunit SecG [Afipia carboxidovorans]ACI93414.1 preprotein translocase SecG subunit [Afipia carboxidovorans OM5]AEI02871.1 SecG family protein [Afipia carboxidovorans OM4]AEI06447.1 SecG family protein [Afipia carboxidovorans OM5]
MHTVIIIIHLIIVIALTGVVLVQRSEGGGLGIGGGGGGAGGFMSSRGTTNLLTRTTAILGTAFFITSLILSWLAGYEQAPRSLINTTPATQSGQAAPEKNLLDSLKPAEPAAPAAPAAPQSK